MKIGNYNLKYNPFTQVGRYKDFELIQLDFVSGLTYSIIVKAGEKTREEQLIDLYENFHDIGDEFLTPPYKSLKHCLLDLISIENEFCCFNCKKKLKEVYKDSKTVYDGMVFETHGNYGSTVYDPCGKESMLYLYLCDSCAMMRKDRLYGSLEDLGE